MEVTNVADKVTHAIIGRGKVESFGMSEDAELYHILSSALYSRKKEAAVREVLCNAWDSHVESKVTETPIEITLTNEKVVIRDFGVGLPPDMIKPVYGTYGKSTKTHDGRVTGGFGLGSKAPFAYVDHFEVTSCHDGLKTIYKMSQSNAEIGGKPSITTIVSIPIDETGLQVSFNLKFANDRSEFESLIRYIVCIGNMNALLNGEKLDIFPFDKAEHGFMLVEREAFSCLAPTNVSSDTIYLRYGHVIYPIEETDAFGTQYKQIRTFISHVSGNSRWGNYNQFGRYHGNKNYALILQAPPHSISVTPSRESLSMTDKTIETITDMMNAFLERNNKGNKFETLCHSMFKEALTASGLVDTNARIYEVSNYVPLRDKIPVPDSKCLFNLEDVARSYLKASYPSLTGFRRQDLMMKVDLLIENKRGNIEDLLAFKHELKHSEMGDSNWFQRQFVRRIVKKADPKLNIDIDRLFCYHEFTRRSTRDTWRETKVTAFQPIRAVRKRGMDKLLPFLRNVIVLTNARTENQVARIFGFPILKFYLGTNPDMLWYVCPRSPNKAERARAYFKSLGMHIIDLTIAHPWEAKDVADPVKRAAPGAPKKKGLVSLSAAYKNGSFNLDYLREDDAARILQPEFIVKISPNQQNHGKIPGTDMERPESLAMAKLYGQFGGVVGNALQEQKYLDLGAKSMPYWLLEKLLHEFQTRPTIKTHYENSLQNKNIMDPDLRHDYSRRDAYILCRSDAELRKKFNLEDKIPFDDADCIILWEYFERYDYRYKTDATYIKIATLIKSWQPNPHMLTFLNKTKDNILLTIINISDAKYILNKDTNTDPLKTKIRNIIITALEG